jgi:TonB family protein
VTFERYFVGGLVLATAMTLSSAFATAQPITNETMPRLTLPVKPENYPAASYFANEEGHVVLIATIGVDGQMSNARLETSSGYAALDEASISLANDARLPTPPTNIAGEPVSVVVLVDVVWELPADPRAAVQNDSPGSTQGRLRLDPSSDFAIAYFNPDADFTKYDKLIFEGPEIAFREGWRRQHIGATLGDMERIKQECAQWFRDVFIAELQDEGGFQFVEEAGENVLLIHAGIGDLDVAAPILASNSDPGYSIAAAGTSATLVLELFDSARGEVLARVFDRQQSASAGFDSRDTRFSNENDARVIFTGWAEILRARLDEDRGN